MSFLLEIKVVLYRNTCPGLENSRRNWLRTIKSGIENVKDNIASHFNRFLALFFFLFSSPAMLLASNSFHRGVLRRVLLLGKEQSFGLGRQKNDAF